MIPDLTLIHFKDGFMLSLPIAVVILTESLLSETSFAIKNNYKINENRELLAFSLSNLSAAVTGCCPVNGSVSRTVMSEQYGAKTKIVSITASIVMVFVLLFATGFIGYLPVPVLTAIVISALIGVLEIHVADKNIEFYITEHIGELNDEMRKLGLGQPVEANITEHRRKQYELLKETKPEIAEQINDWIH